MSYVLFPGNYLRGKVVISFTGTPLGPSFPIVDFGRWQA